VQHRPPSYRKITHAESTESGERRARPRLTHLLLVLVLAAVTYSTVTAAELVRDERRLWSDGTPQEVWTYEGSIAPENLVQKDLLYEDGTKRRREEYTAGVQHGATTAWYEEGTKELEEVWVDGGRHGVVRHWPNPGTSEQRKKQLKPTLEATWENGTPSGLWREWKGWGDDRWLHVEKTYVQGELDGFETVWRDADSMERKHSFSGGALDGRQFAWEYNGQMMYQYQFAGGEPEGPQRKYEQDVVIQELFFVAGKLHGKMVWEGWLDHLGADWENGIRSDTTTREDGTIRSIRRWSFVPDDRFDSNGYLQFHGETEEFDITSFDDLGRRETLRVSGPPESFTHFWPNGEVRRMGKGRPGSPKGGVREFYEDGSLHREEKYLDGKRTGIWTVRDRKGRVVSHQTWDYYLMGHVVTEWHSDEVKAAEGSVQHAHGQTSGGKIGEWNYWTPEGRLFRTETYGPGPYSGNRAFIYSMTQWDDVSRPEFEGSEKELILFEYDEEDPEVVRRRRTVKLIDRPRGGLESWDSETLQVIRADVTNTHELVEGAPVVEMLGGRGVVLMDERFRSDGTPKRTERYSKNGARSGEQEGWYRNGSRAYAFKYVRGGLSYAEEWWSDGTLRLAAQMGSSNGEPELRALVAKDKGGREWTLEDRGLRWRAPAEVLDQCQLWRFDPSTPKP